MFRIISNIVASFIRHASIAQRLDDAVSFADGQCELVANLQLELANTYRRIDGYRNEITALQAATTQSHRDTYNKMLDACGQVEVMMHELRVLNLDRDAYKDSHEVIASDNVALRRSLAEMRAERDALKNEVATLRAAAAPRPAGDDSQYEETAYGWRRITPEKFAALNELVDRADPFDGGCAHDCADR